MTADELRPIPGFPGYSITSDGRVWSHPRAWTGVNGITYSHPGMWMRSTLESERGYHVITLSVKGATRSQRTQQVHRLVAFAWLPNDDATKDCINHRNGVKTDNRVENLEWCTRGQNIKHAYDTGLIRDRRRRRSSKGQFASRHSDQPKGEI